MQDAQPSTVLGAIPAGGRFLVYRLTSNPGIASAVGDNIELSESLPR